MRPTRMIDWDKHPRIGMLDVEVIDTLRAGLASDVKIKVTARDMYNNFKPLEGFRGDDNVWHFESDPLLTTVPNLYNVKFELVRERKLYELIPGKKKSSRLEASGVAVVNDSTAAMCPRMVPERIASCVFFPIRWAASTSLCHVKSGS